MSLTRTRLTFLMVFGVLSLVLLTACTTDASRIREANKAFRGITIPVISTPSIPTPFIVPSTGSSYVEAYPVFDNPQFPTIAPSTSIPIPTSSPTSIPTSSPTSIPTPFPTSTSVPTLTPPTATSVPSTPTPPPIEADISATSLEDGDCARSNFTDDEILSGNTVKFYDFVLLPCDGPWQFRVVSSFLVELDAGYIGYPSDEKFMSLAQDNCKRTYTLPFFPLFESWRLGDRTVHCIQMDMGIAHSDFARLDNIIDPYLVKVEECFNELDEGLAYEILSCAGEWQYRIVEIISLALLEEFPGDEYIWTRTLQDCDRRSSMYFLPTHETWIDEGARLIYCAQGGQGLSGYSLERIDRIVGEYKLNAGECYNEDTSYASPLVEIVACDGPWEYKILDRLILDRDGLYPEDLYFDTEVFNRCNRFYDYSLSPTQERWEAGIKYILCIQER
ncbi:hypothetical protein LCGC14_0347790 [marine sediment metagenome]|uniref:Septum formation-related domain-containing protein n=1 Tax=marine sediment metagenome TaxID=412755 RepID=A0A0F9TUR8_9ZZZZ